MAVKKKTAGKKKIVKKVVKAAPKKKPTKKVAKTSSKKRGFGYESLFMSFEDGDESLIEDDTTVEDEDIAEVVVDTTSSDETIDGVNVSDVEDGEDNTEAVERWLYSLESEVEEAVNGDIVDDSSDNLAEVVENSDDLEAEDGVNVVTEDEVYEEGEEEGDEAEEDGEEEVVVDTSDDDESDDTIEEVTVQDEDGDEYTAELGSAERWFRSVESEVEDMLGDADPNVSTEDDDSVDSEDSYEDADEDDIEGDSEIEEGESLESLLFSISKNINKIKGNSRKSTKSDDLISSIF